MQVMRYILLFLVLVIVVLVAAYVFVPVEQMQARAKDTIQQAQTLHTSLDFDTVVDGFGALFERQEYVPGGGGGQESAVDVVDVPPQSVDETIFEGESDAILVR